MGLDVSHGFYAGHTSYREFMDSLWRLAGYGPYELYHSKFSVNFLCHNCGKDYRHPNTIKYIPTPKEDPLLLLIYTKPDYKIPVKKLLELITRLEGLKTQAEYLIRIDENYQHLVDRIDTFIKGCHEAIADGKPINYNY